MMIGKKKQLILLGAVRSIVGGSLCIADSLKLFDNAGLSIKIIWYQNGKEVLEALTNNIIDVAFAGTIPYESMINTHIIHIAKIAEGNDTQIVLDTDIKNIIKLRRIKKIGVISNTASLKARESFQLSNNLSPKKIELVEMNSYDMPSSFARGIIHGFVIREPFISYAQSLLGNTITIYNNKSDSYTWYMNLFVTNESYIKQKEIVTLLKNIFFSANRYINEHREESIEIIASYTQISYNIINKNWKRYTYYMG